MLILFVLMCSLHPLFAVNILTPLSCCKCFLLCKRDGSSCRLELSTYIISLKGSFEISFIIN